jgi:hypothetical protein
MGAQRSLSRRDFLRLRTTERGRVVEVACRTLYMRCADAAIEPDPIDYDSIVGEPPAVFERRSALEIIDGVADELKDAQILRLLEPEWLENMPAVEHFRAAVEAFTRRGGRVEQ